MRLGPLPDPPTRRAAGPDNRRKVVMQEPWRSALAFILVIAILLLLLRLFNVI